MPEYRRMDISDNAGDLMAEFYYCPIEDRDKVRIFIPGDKLTQPHFLATEEYQDKFPKQWKAFQDQQEQNSDKTPLESVNWMDEVTRNRLKSLGIFNIEALAAVSDNNLTAIGNGGRTLRTRAMEELVSIKATDEVNRLEDENAKLREALAAAATPKTAAKK